MNILAVDTSTDRGSVALAVKGEPVAVEASEGGSHSVWLLRAVDRLLHATGVAKEQIEGFGIVVGPGSFTGLRIGIATVKGLAAAGGRPCASVVSLDAMAAAMARIRPDAQLVPLIDAKKGEVYFAVYRVVDGILQCLRPPVSAPPSEAIAHLASDAVVAGSGVPLLGSATAAAVAQIDLPPIASEVARAASLVIEAGQGIGPEAIEPLYLRKSEAELKGRPPDAHV